jgi:hypothetical protein
MDNSIEKLTDDFIKNNIKDINSEYIKIITFIIKESNKLNLSKDDINNHIDNILTKYNICDNDYKTISNNLLNTLFNNSKIKNIKKTSHINNINTIKRNLNELLNKYIYHNDITSENFMKNIYNILELLIENLHKYEINKNKPSVIIYEVIDKQFNILLKDKLFLIDNNLIKTIVTEYVDSFIEVDNDESNILLNELKKNIFSNIFKCFSKNN